MSKLDAVNDDGTRTPSMQELAMGTLLATAKLLRRMCNHEMLCVRYGDLHNVA